MEFVQEHSKEYKFSFNSRNTVFGQFLVNFSNFLGKNNFSRKFWSCNAQLYMGSYYDAKIKKKNNENANEKANDTIPNKSPDRQKNGQQDEWDNRCKDGLKDQRMDRPCFIGPFQLLPGVQKVDNIFSSELYSYMKTW